MCFTLPMCGIGGGGATVKVYPSVEKGGGLVAEGLAYKITSFTDKTAEIFSTSNVVDKATYTGEFKIPSYIEYNGKKFTVTSIREYVFEGFSCMTSVILPPTITTIEKRQFYGCKNLTSVKMSTSITSICNSAFENCSRLASIDIPNSVREIDYNAFYNCSNLTSIKIPNSVTEIGSNAFFGCTRLTTIVAKPTSPPINFHRYHCEYFSSYDGKLIVPTASIEAYKSTYPWSKFKNIEGGAENY